MAINAMPVPKKLASVHRTIENRDGARTTTWWKRLWKKVLEFVLVFELAGRAELALSIIFRLPSALRSTLLLTKFLVTSPLALLLRNNASCGVLPQHRFFPDPADTSQTDR